MPEIADSKTGPPLDRNSPARAMPGTFVSVDDGVVIEAEHFTRKDDDRGTGWHVRPALGRNGAAISSTTELSAQTTIASAHGRGDRATTPQRCDAMVLSHDHFLKIPIRQAGTRTTCDWLRSVPARAR
jgi:hypothetical protein